MAEILLTSFYGKLKLEVLNVNKDDFRNDEEEDSKYESVLGGNPENPTWAEYLDDWNEQGKELIQMIKDAVKELGWIGEKADRICNDTVFKFCKADSGEHIVTLGFSWRAWGDLMQAIVDKKEGYMRYYM